MATFAAASAAVTSEIIQPIRQSGDEVALIFVPGAFQRGQYYREIARVIQEASQLRVWAALTDGYDSNYPNPRQLPGAVEGAIKGLKQAGMISETYIGIGHSRGGVVIGSYGRSSQLKAVVLMGAFLNSTLRDYPIPILTLAAELDGRVRITRVVNDFEELLDDASQSKDAIFRTPVINVQGTNHLQFETRSPIPRNITLDIKSDVTDAEALKTIAHYVNSFITSTFSTDATQVKDAQEQLKDDFTDSRKRFQPILDMKALEENGDSCPWAIIVQQYFAGKFADVVVVNNDILELPEFNKSKPSLREDKGKIEIDNTAFIEFEEGYEYNFLEPQSPKEIRLKLKSKAAINDALCQAPGKEPSCRSLNELAMEYALNSSNGYAVDRYNLRGRPIFFEDDIMTSSENEWLSTPLNMWEDDGLHVQAVALVTSINSPKLEGMHYCKVMAPYRALEWIIIDSLRDY